MIFVSYLTTSWRHIVSHKLFSVINILGLAIGLAAVILIALFVRDELNYDNFWSNADNIYRTEVTLKSSGREDMRFVQTPGLAIHAFRKDFPQLEHAARLWRRYPKIIQDDQVFLDEITLVDPEIIDIFDFEVLEGDLKAAMSRNNSLVLDREMARKYYGEKNAIGETLTIDFGPYDREYVVTAIIEDMPKNSHLDINSMVLIVEEDWEEVNWIFHDWNSMGSMLFYSLIPGSDIAEINSQMGEFVNRNVPNTSSNPDRKVSDYFFIKSVNIKDIHLKSIGTGEYRVKGSVTTVVIFSSIAVLILIIAIINFINLSTSRASQRAKEVSLRKVVGASRKDLIVQFLGESVALAIIAFLIALVIVEMALPLYNDILVKELSMAYRPGEIFGFGVFVFVVGFFSALYPAMVLSNYRPAEVLKANKSSESGASSNLRMMLVIVQFAVSISLFISTAVVYAQLQYAKKMDLGFNEENLLVVKQMYRDEAQQNLQFFINEFRRLQGVGSVSWGNFVPGDMNENNTLIRTDTMSIDDSLPVGVRRIGYEFFETFQTELLAGREFNIGRNDTPSSLDDSGDSAGNRSSIVLNASASRNLGFATPDQAIGATLYRGRDERITEYEVIGVIPDLHHESVRKNTRSEIYTLSNTNVAAIFVRYAGEPLELVDKIQPIWSRVADGLPLEYAFVTESIADQYNAEQGQTTMLAAFSMLAIFIACLGLFGLAGFTVEHRKKEIGIRKVLGAGSQDIIWLMLWQFSKPVIIANIIAWPFSYLIMSKWLEGFAYRIGSYEIIVYCISAGIAALLLAWLTVANNTYMITRTNPIKALRDE